MSATARVLVGIALVVLFGVIVAFAVGAISLPGDDEPAFTREVVEERMGTLIREQMEQNGATIDDLECIEDGDNLHWKCLTTAYEGASKRFRLTVNITCDASTGKCLSEPSIVEALP